MKHAVVYAADNKVFAFKIEEGGVCASALHQEGLTINKERLTVIRLQPDAHRLHCQ